MILMLSENIGFFNILFEFLCISLFYSLPKSTISIISSNFFGGKMQTIKLNKTGGWEYPIVLLNNNKNQL